MAQALGAITQVVFVVAIVGGIFHSFKSHGTAKGFLALALPPIAAYRGFEALFHERDDESAQVVVSGEDSSANAGDAVAVPLSSSEADVVSRVTGAALSGGTLRDADLAALEETLGQYVKRGGTQLSPQDAQTFRTVMELTHAYNLALGKNVLFALDTRTPRLMNEFRLVRTEMRSAGLMDESKLAFDSVQVVSAAFRTKYSDPYGKEYNPPDRARTLELLRHIEARKVQLDRLAEVYTRFANRGR